ncbi:protein of unknown function [Taphrina deformans PYCC 5710]|uniref:Pescadillo homolog n=1 Tax=Taphrina deformans (strain PYCC 5710 / ATCC 11124 / CBS 356.35 / IMI 108563 / JCM 9778 / NBRC 8474) TaxID=1097556 RepID=R4XGA1_TAPDE|nr:protein of unknown function [Taphrina deformans PYCC 5710]|eukprot:CCG84785.1 protein of unknown function [Taphrina deformans PYCC 5710]
MAKIKRKGESGAAKNFISRNMAIKKLQVTLADFRRLCILKGIYPREPRNKKKANKGSTAPTTFYYTKDISYLVHEPVLNKFRDHKIFARKLSKALGKQEYNTAKKLEENKPTYTLDHIIKERYPTFIDALRDLDDALSMLFLFASMPTTDKVGATIVANCDRLCREFEHYVIRSKALRKVFLSIKGIYYQAEIKGQDITWLVPYKFSQQVPTDVDFRIMLTFLEFHQTYVGFVNYRLYTELGLVYPPKIDQGKEDEAGGLSSLDVQRKGLAGQDEKVKKLKPKKTSRQIASLDMGRIAESRPEDDEASESEAEENDIDDGEADMDDFSTVAPAPKEGDDEPLPQQATSAPTNLLSNFTFYLSREVPRYSLEFVIKAFGGKVAWDAILGAGSPLVESDGSITHHVCDRPKQEKKYQGRTYVQPQWIYDCINKGKLQPADSYGPGAILPPHLSPFAKIADGAYDPEEAMEEPASDEEEEELDAAADDAVLEIEPEELGAIEAQAELEAEASGVPFSEAQKTVTKKTPKNKVPLLSTAEKSEKEGKELARMMMSNKQKKLYAKMQYSNKAKEDEVANLRKKRKDIAKAGKKASSSKKVASNQS